MIGCRRSERQIRNAHPLLTPDEDYFILIPFVDERKGVIAKYRLRADEMEELLSKCPTAAVDWSPDVDRWSILEIAAHLADAELLASAPIQ
jgi:hypothetical protein